MTKRYLSLPIFGLLATLAMPATAQDADTVVAAGQRRENNHWPHDNCPSNIA